MTESSESLHGLPVPARYWAMLAVVTAIAMNVMNGLMVPVALPVIQSSLDVPPNEAVLVITVFQVTVLVSLLPMSALGERLGLRRIFCGGLAVFAVGSLFCSLASSLGGLLAGRILQGLGSAGAASMTPALTRAIFPPQKLGRGMGISVLSVGIAASVAPLVATGLLRTLDWSWLFAATIPLSLLALVFALRFLPRFPGRPQPLDKIGVVLNLMTFGLLIIGINGLGNRTGFRLPIMVLVAAVLSGTLLWRNQIRQSRPLLPLDILRRPMFTFSISASLLAFTAQTMTFITLPFLLHWHAGVAMEDTGLYLVAWPAAAAVVSPLAGRLGDRHPISILGTGGLIVLFVGLSLLASVGNGASATSVLWRLAICGTGFALFQSPNNRAIMISAPAHRGGAAAGMLATARLLGQTLGAALAGMIFGLAGERATHFSLHLVAALALLAAIVSGLRKFLPQPHT